MPIQLGDITLYSILELAEKLDITPATLRGYLKSGKLHGQKVGTKWYVTEESLKAFFNGPSFSERNTSSQVEKQTKDKQA